MLVELPSLLSESDLHIAQLTLNLLTSIARLQRGCLANVTSTSLPHVFKLAQSPLLQGAALSSMLDFFQVGVPTILRMGQFLKKLAMSMKRLLYAGPRCRQYPRAQPVSAFGNASEPGV